MSSEPNGISTIKSPSTLQFNFTSEKSVCINANEMNSGTVLGTLLLTGCVVLLVWYLQWHWKRRHLYWAASKVRGPMWLPFIGSALRFSGGTEDILENVVKLTSEFETPFVVWLGHRLFYAITKAEHFKIVLNSPKALQKEDLYKYAYPLFGMGLFTSPVKRWKLHRRILSPTFNQKILDSFMDTFNEQSEILLNCMKEDVGKDFDILERFSRLALDNICDSAMGKKAHTQTTNSEFVTKLQRGLWISFIRMFQVWYHFDAIFNQTSYCKEEKEIVKDMKSFTEQIVKSKKEEYQLKKSDIKLTENESKRKVLLDLMIELSENGANFTDNDLRDHISSFVIAGSDTTATINSFVLLIFGLYPEIQERVYKEVMDQIGPDRPINKEDLHELKYLERVIKETMRVFPVAPVIVRKITEDLDIGGGVVLPTGSSVVLAIYILHFDPKHWEDPWTFDPDRFSPERTAGRDLYAYCPFSAGPRNCIGARYAMMAMKVAIATVVRKYKSFTDYKSLREIRVQQDLIIKPADGFKVRIEERH